MKSNAIGRLITLSFAALFAALFLIFATAYIVAGPVGAVLALAVVGATASAIRSTLPRVPRR